MIPPRDKAKNKCWYWVWLVFIVWIAMNISSSDITTGIILLAIGGLLTLIGQWLYRKLSHWFSPQEELCEVFFLNIDKAGNRLHQKVLRRPYNKELQSIPVYTQSSNPKETTLEMTRRYTQALGFEDVFKRHVLASPVDRLIK